MVREKQTVAVIGAGITGSVAALMLADLGYRVCVFDRAAKPMSGASLVNEGKIHLGFVYVNDPSLRSLDVMVETAVVFRSILERWIPKSVFDQAVTEPFEYIVPKDTQVAPDEIERKFAIIADKITEAEIRNGNRYLGMDRSSIWKRHREVGTAFNQESIIAHFETMERSVDTHLIAQVLSKSLETHAGIDLHLNHHVSAIRKPNTHWAVDAESEGTIKTFSPFNYIINASWEGRLKLDEQLFGPDNTRWFHRFKHAVNLRPDQARAIPNFTAIIGTYGDVIKYPTGRVYLSYYPAGMLSASDKVNEVQTVYAETTRQKIASGTIEGLSHFWPGIETVFSECRPSGKDVAGGIIMARGKTDIDDKESELHQRYQIGIRQKDTYFSIDTGKYTCGPALAKEAVSRISA